jgi:hypothetical protein
LLLRDGETCPRVARADRASLLVDMECYFEAAKVAMSHARRSIHFLNWAFEPQTFLEPGPDSSGEDDDRIANFLKSLWLIARTVAIFEHFESVRKFCFGSTPERCRSPAPSTGSCGLEANVRSWRIADK